MWPGKPIDSVEEADVRCLIDDQTPEGLRIEYKEQMYSKTDRDKREMLKDIVSMANAEGGVIVIGIRADSQGVPQEIVGIPKEQHRERVTSSCLDNLEPRLVGLQAKDVDIANDQDKEVLVISVPRSFSAPHMITFQAMNQFWVRHGRQKSPMTVREIQAKFEQRAAGMNKIEQLLQDREAQLLKEIGQALCIVVSASPVFLEEEVIDTRDVRLRELVRTWPRNKGKWIGLYIEPDLYVTLFGIRSEWQAGPTSFEIHRAGLIEYAEWREQSEPVNSVRLACVIYDFLSLAAKVYGHCQIAGPVTVRLLICNAQGRPLRRHEGFYPDSVSARRAFGPHLRVGPILLEDVEADRGRTVKRLNDMVWNAYNLEEAPTVDANGELKLK